jgi:hypothetical protein
MELGASASASHLSSSANWRQLPPRRRQVNGAGQRGVRAERRLDRARFVGVDLAESGAGGAQHVQPGLHQLLLALASAAAPVAVAAVVVQSRRPR